MKIKIYAIGKIKEQYLKEGIDVYLKRIQPYSQIEIVEVNDEPIAENPHDSEIKKAIDLEGQKILKLLKANEYLIGLDLNKKELNSVEFAEYLHKKCVLGRTSISFVIGGSYG